MSLDLKVYTKEINDSIIPAWIHEMNQTDMICEIHPNFSFSDHSGFLPFKIKFIHHPNTTLNGKELIAGFELYVEHFDLKEEKEKLKPKKTFFQKLLKQKDENVIFANKEIDNKLKDCNKVLIFNWGSADSFELRIAALSSAIISKLNNGVCYYPADNIWYDNQNIVEEALKEVQDYENSLGSNQWKIHEFKKWD